MPHESERIGGLNYFLDIGAAAVIIICVSVGSRRGAVRMLLSVIGYIAAFAAAVFVSNSADGYVYDRFVRPAVMSAMEEKAEELAEDYGGVDALKEILSENDVLSDFFINGEETLPEDLTEAKIRDTLNRVFIDYCGALTETFSGTVPEEIVREAESYLKETDMENERKLELLTSARQSATELIEIEIVRPVMMRIVKTVLFSVTFALVCVLFAVISKIAGLIRRIPAVRSLDGFAGGFLGLFQGIMIMAVICAAAGVYIKLTGRSADIIEQTYIFRHFYSGAAFLISLLLG